MANTYKTPGVYIEEKSAFPNSAVPVATAVPAFIGYTERAERNEQPLLLLPTRISSFGEYETYFGGGPTTRLTISKPDDPDVPYSLAITERHFTLFSQMKLFFSNGGSDCYLVSVGGYTRKDGTPNAIDLDVLKAGIPPLLKETEPTVLVIPEAVHAPVGADSKAEDLKAIYLLHQDMLRHCGVETKSRFAITDVWMNPATYSDPGYQIADDVNPFRNGIGTNNLQWGAAYFPWLHTTALGAGDVDFRNIINLGEAKDVKPFPQGTFDDHGAIVDRTRFQADFLIGDAYSLAAVLDRSLNQAVFDGTAKPGFATRVKESLLTELVAKALTAEAVGTLHKSLMAISTLYTTVLHEILKLLNLLPPSAAMAGIYSIVDNQVGVFKSPANVNVGSVLSPAVDISNDQQEDLNVPIDGKAVNAIRTFPGRGVLVWGARTLDANSMDWRYISVRRTIIYLEQSIKAAVESYVFEPNVATTWQTVKTMLTNFLTNEWKRGALAGASPEDAFSVDVGLGSTMTAVDILDGLMRISVKIAITRPAEFIVITFEQKMQQS